MNKKRIFTIIFAVVALVGAITGYSLWAMSRADYYAGVSRETENSQDKMLALEKSTQLWPKTETILGLADLYISIGRNDLAEKIMMGRGDPQILNKLGNLYLDEEKIKEAENAFTKAKNKKINPDSLKGLILVELKKSDRGVAEKYLNQLSEFPQSTSHLVCNPSPHQVCPPSELRQSANCYASFIRLNDFKRTKDAFVKAKSCNLYDIDKYFSKINEAQNPLYLKLEATNLYYSQNYLNIAEKDILALLKEKDNYRDAHILASKIYEKLGDQVKASNHKQKATEIDYLLR